MSRQFSGRNNAVASPRHYRRDEQRMAGSPVAKLISIFDAEFERDDIGIRQNRQHYSGDDDGGWNTRPSER